MAYSYYAEIDIDKTKCGTENSTDFPMLFSGTYNGTSNKPDLRSVSNGGKITSSSAYDISFYSDVSLTTQLKYERILHDVSTGEVVYWVKIPTLTYATNTKIYVAYGDSNISTDQQTKNDTWTANYKAVYHFNQTSGTDILDSTSNTSTATATRTNILNHKGGKVGYYGQFVRSSEDRATIANNEILRPSGNFTITALIKKDTLTGYMFIMSSYWLAGFTAGFNDGNKIRIALDSTEFLGNTAQTDTTNWHHVAIIYNGSTVSFYFDGASNGSISWSTAPTYNADNKPVLACINYAGTHYHHFDGGLSEIRLNNGTALTESWILSESNNQLSPSTFYSIGDETSTNAPPNTPTNSTPANAATGVSRNPTLTASTFSDPDAGNTHAGSQWLVATDSGFTDTVWDSGDDATHLTSTTVNATNGTFGGTRSGKTTLASNTQHYWKVRYKDNNGSWSSYS